MLETKIEELTKTMVSAIAVMKSVTEVMSEVSKNQNILIERSAEAMAAASTGKSLGRRKKAAEPAETKAVETKSAPATKSAPDTKAAEAEETPKKPATDAKLAEKSEVFPSEAELTTLGKKWVTSVDGADKMKRATFIRNMGYATGAYAEGEKVKLGGEGCKFTPAQRKECAFFIQRADKLGMEKVDFDASYDFNGPIDQPTPGVTEADDLDLDVEF